MGSAMLMGERVQRRESCDARSEVGAYLYKTVMCEKSSVCSWANVAVPCGAVRGQRAERVVRSQWSGPNRSDAQKTRTVGIPRCQDVWLVVWTRTVVKN